MGGDRQYRSTLRQGYRRLPVDPLDKRKRRPPHRHHVAHGFLRCPWPKLIESTLVPPQDGRQHGLTRCASRTPVPQARRSAPLTLSVRKARGRRADHLERGAGARRRRQASNGCGNHQPALLLAMAQRWKHRPPNSNWGEFGPDDQRGRMNYVTREKVLQGAAEVKEGRTFCLSLPLDYPGGNVLNPRRNPPRLAPTVRAGKANSLLRFGDENRAHRVVCDDLVLLTLQYSTQWDSLPTSAQFDARRRRQAGAGVLQRLSRGEDIRCAGESGAGPGRGSKARAPRLGHPTRRARRAGARRLWTCTRISAASARRSSTTR